MKAAQPQRPPAMMHAAFIILLFLLFVPLGNAEEHYPSHPVTFIVPWGPGGGADTFARTLSPLLEKELHASFPVVNVPGATGQTGLAKMLSAPADGQIISVMTADTLLLLAGRKLRWGLDDFIPVAIMINQPSAFFVSGKSNIKTWNDLVDAAKKHPLKVAITGLGGPEDTQVKWFEKKGIPLHSVPYPKPSKRYVSLLGGHTDVLYEQFGDVQGYLRDRQMRPIVVLDSSRFPAFPDVPTSKELGYPISVHQIRMVIMKSGTDESKVKAISDALAHIASSPVYKQYIKQQYASENSYIPRSEARKFLEHEIQKLKMYAAEAEANKQ